MYKLSLIKKQDKTTIIIDFTKEEINLLNTNINQLIKNKKLNWSYYVISENYQHLLKQTDFRFKELSKDYKNLNWEKLETTTKELNKNLFNFLSSLNAFLDHSQHYLSQNFGKASEQYLNYKLLQKELYNQNFAYRLFYNLRNYTIHCGYALNAITIETNPNKVTFTPKFIIEELKEYKKWQTDVKKDLKNISDDFAAFNLVKTVFKNYTKLYEYLKEIINPNDKKNSEDIIKTLKVEKENIKDYCFLINNNGTKKIGEIPVHYL